ncbi:MAG: ATP-dependent helicase [Oleiphilaceae bacterium]|nr:ATP-dependent helicase [Oleiphilaceae bacterium]
MRLTEEQQAIVQLGHEHCVITAVAGSGKTTTLAWRIRQLLRDGQDPRRMLILMFNRSARVDFQRKLAEITRGEGLRLPEVRTYHAMGLRLYQRFVREGYLPPYQGEVMGEQEIHYQVWQLTLQLAPEELQDEIKRHKKEFVASAANFLDRVKSTLDAPEIVFEAMDFAPQYRYLLSLYERFEQWRRQQRRITFADMLHEPVVAIHRHPALKALVADKMDMVLVDEYQDSNEIQHLLIRYVAGERARVTVVGDPDQTIYEFRGARPDFILSRFAREFPGAVALNLSFSFRYGHRVALLANHLIAGNRDRKQVLCHSHPGTPDTRIHLARPRHEADYIARLATEHQKAGQPLSQLAVLVRVWSQSVPIELHLLSRQIPYQIDARKGALFTREVEALTALLALAAGELSDGAGDGSPQQQRSHRQQVFRQLLRFPHVGLREPELNALADQLAQHSHGWGQLLQHEDNSHWKPLPKRKIRRLGEALERIEHNRAPCHRLIKEYAEHTELFEGLRSLALTHEMAEERIGTVTGFQHYLATLDLQSGPALDHVRGLKARAAQSEGQGLHLSTIHRTKGLEWPVVVIPGLQEKYLPYTSRHSDDLPGLIESERRLLYVGMTRSRDSLHLLTSTPGEHSEPEQQPSRFLEEMRLPLCDELGERLHRPPPGGEIALENPLSTVALDYAALHRVTLSAPSPGPVDTATHPEPDTAVWQHRHVHHILLGDGEILGDRGSSFEVRFGNQERRHFSKHNAHLYFRLKAPDQAHSDGTGSGA